MAEGEDEDGWNSDPSVMGSWFQRRIDALDGHIEHLRSLKIYPEAEDALRPTINDYLRLGEYKREELRALSPGLLYLEQRASANLKLAIDAFGPVPAGTSVEASINRTIEHLQNVYQDLDPLLARLEANRRAKEAEPQKQLRELLEGALQARQEFSKLATDARASLDNAIKAAEREGLTRGGMTLSRAVNDHKRAACVWGWAAAGFAVAIVVVAAVGIWCSGDVKMPGQPWYVADNFRYYISRALLVSVLSFLLVVSVRNYRAAKHNQIVSYHRWSALATFRRFEAATEGAMREAVLTRAADAIFVPQPTGYADKDPVGGGTHLAELARWLKGGN